jgi:hypothetical protein
MAAVTNVAKSAQPAAGQKQFNAREIADRIRRPHETTKTVIDRIRSWADYGLLQPAGEKHPGTGKKRRYGPETIIDAIVLTALTDCGLAAVRVGHFAGADGATLLAYGRRGACEVLDPDKLPGGMTSLVISGSSTPDHPATVILNLGKVAGAPFAPWSIAVNLYEYLVPLRGKVSAVEEDGVVKIDLIQEDTHGQHP